MIPLKIPLYFGLLIAATEAVFFLFLMELSDFVFIPLGIFTGGAIMYWYFQSIRKTLGIQKSPLYILKYGISGVLTATISLILLLIGMLIIAQSDEAWSWGLLIMTGMAILEIPSSFLLGTLVGTYFYYQDKKEVALGS